MCELIKHMDSLVVYNELRDDPKECSLVKLTVKEAVNLQKQLVSKKGFEYASDLDALYDFMTVNWAWFEKKSKVNVDA